MAKDKLSKSNKQMLKNIEIAKEIVLLEDKELMEELTKY